MPFSTRASVTRYSGGVAEDPPTPFLGGAGEACARREGQPSVVEQPGARVLGRARRWPTRRRRGPAPALGRAGLSCASRGGSRSGPSAALIVVAMLVMAAGAERIAPYGYDESDPRRADEAASARPLAGDRQPQPRHLEPDRLRRARLGDCGLRDDRPRHPDAPRPSASPAATSAAPTTSSSSGSWTPGCRSPT